MCVEGEGREPGVVCGAVCAWALWWATCPAMRRAARYCQIDEPILAWSFERVVMLPRSATKP